MVVVDPIDGSLNAKRCLPFWCISLAFADGPTLDDVRFGYIRDFGTRRGVGGEARPRARRSTAGRSAAPARRSAWASSISRRRTPAWWPPPRRGSTGTSAASALLGALALALCQLADGRVDGVATLKPSRSVDLAAAALIVREAGAALVTWDHRDARRSGWTAARRAVAARDETWCGTLGELVYG